MGSTLLIFCYPGNDITWVDYIVEATSIDGISTVSPPKGFHDPYEIVVVPGKSQSSIVINEILASNKNTEKNPCSLDYDDAFELYNPSDSDIDISGWKITNGKLNGLETPAVWIVPNVDGAVVPAGGHLVVWCVGGGRRNLRDRVSATKEGSVEPIDKRTATPACLQATFKLDADGGEYIAVWIPPMKEVLAEKATNTGLLSEIVTTDRLVDSVRFKRQTRDISYSRIPDGSLSWHFTTLPTVGSENGNTGLPDR